MSIIRKATESKLNLGCGNEIIPGFINLDIGCIPGIDLSADCECKKFGLPFKKNLFVEVRASHLLEHIQNFIGLMEEIHRICLPGGKILIWVPYYRYEGAFHDPTHVRFFAERSFDIFSSQYKYNYYTKARFDLVDMRLNIVQKTSVPSLAKKVMKFPIPMRIFFNNFMWNLYSEIYYELLVIK
jgi:SAM-dependent methyltransferase